jgi:hypothetical protein
MIRGYRLAYRQLSLVTVTVGELGFRRRAGFAEICIVGRELGLHVCPSCVAPYLMLRHAEPVVEKALRVKNGIYVAMHPIMSRLGQPMVFVCARPFGSSLLCADFAHPHEQFSQDDSFLFVKQ